METIVLDRGPSTFLVNSAHIARSSLDVADMAASIESGWKIEESNPFVTWIAGDFVEGDNPNSNKQFWTAGDLELAEYTIKYAPLNMVHKFRTPVGFYAATRTVALKRSDDEASQGSMKIQALSGLWSHIFPFEAAQVQAADEDGLLFYSMECRGSHLICAGENGCGETFDYLDVQSHCEHLIERSSIRHIVNPVFRGGALIIPPVRPGWKNAHASVISQAVKDEAALFAEQTQDQYTSIAASGIEMTTSAWEQLMAMVLTAHLRPTTPG
jgi:hypothetical protein